MFTLPALFAETAPAWVEVLEIALILGVLAGWPLALLLAGYIFLTRDPPKAEEEITEAHGAALAAKAMIQRGAAVLDTASALSFERKRREADALGADRAGVFRLN